MPERIFLFQVPIEILIQFIFRSIGRKKEHLDVVSVGFEPHGDLYSMMYPVVVEDQEHLLSVSLINLDINLINTDDNIFFRYGLSYLLALNSIAVSSSEIMSPLPSMVRTAISIAVLIGSTESRA